MKLTGDELLAAWREAKMRGVKRVDFAESLGLSEGQIHNKLKYAKRMSSQGKFCEVMIGDDYRSSKSYIDDNQDGNYRIITAKMERIYSMEELLERCNVDMTVWRIDDRIEIGSHEMGRRAEVKDIKWEDGKIITGFSEDSGQLHINTLFRYRIPLVRINPIPVTPVVSPVEISVKALSQTVAKKSDAGKALLIPDMHIGFRKGIHNGELTPMHDRLAMSIVMQIAQKHDFDAVTYLGDFVDLSEWSDKFLVQPEFYWATQPAFIECSWYFAQLKSALEKAKHAVLQGNHELRFHDKVVRHMKAAYQLKPATELELDEPMSVQRMIGMDTLGIDYIDGYPNNEIYHGDYLRCIHGSVALQGYNASVNKMTANASISTVFGHIHRLEFVVKTVDDIDGVRYVTMASPGCLCRIDYTVPGHKRGTNWNQGFGVAHFGGKNPQIELIPVRNGKALYNGIEYTGYDYVEELKKDSGWDF